MRTDDLVRKAGIASRPTLPPEVEQDHYGGARRYTFPRRDLGKLQLIGLVFFLAAILMMVLPWVTMGGPLLEDPSAPLPFLIFMAIWSLSLVPPAIFGLMLWKGRTRLSLAGDHLITAEHYGPFRWRRKFRIDRIKRLVAHYSRDGKVEINGRPSDKFPQLASAGMLVADVGKKMPGFVLLLYPKDWIIAVGEELAERMQLKLEHNTSQAPGGAGRV